MKQTTKKSILKVFLGIFVLFVFSMNPAAKIKSNYSENAFEEPARTEIRLYVIEAAGCFLKSQAYMLLFLNKIELEEKNEIDYAELRQIINDAVVHMEMARAKYNDPTQLADNAPYDQPTIHVLMGFDYTSFQGNKVETYLSSGDVRGLYHRLLTDTQSILDQLTVIKSAVDAQVIPKNSDLWLVNKSYCETLLFGQYAAEIFYDIAGK